VIEEQADKRRDNSFWRELPILLGVAIVVALLVRAFLLQTFYIPSGSMEHTLNINDRVFVNKVMYDFRDPHRGEIVVFNAPLSWRSNPSEKDFIKRVIGVGGDHVVCCDARKRLTINGAPLDEPYLNRDGGSGRAASPNEFDIVVPQGRLWVMGDNRYDSGDSERRYTDTNGDLVASTVSVDSVVGRAFLLFWPFSRGDWLTVPKGFDSIPNAAAS
jgi:signal peptidase I